MVARARALALGAMRRPVPAARVAWRPPLRAEGGPSPWKTGWMYLYVEMWNAKPSWLGLNDCDRQAFMTGVDQFLAKDMSDDCRVIGTCVNDGGTAPRAPYTYLVVWEMKDASYVREIADGTARTGWYEYFDQVNIGGPQLTADELVTQLMGL